MFELDGRHLKTAYGKDLLDHLLSSMDSGMVKASLDADVRMSDADNRLALVESRVDLVRRDLRRSRHRVDVVVALAAEETDAGLNERFIKDFIIIISVYNVTGSPVVVTLVYRLSGLSIN